MKHHLLSDLWISSTRYYLGRMTISARRFCDLLVEHWSEIPKHGQGIIRRDIKRAIDSGRIGMDIDEAKWVKTLELLQVQ